MMSSQKAICNRLSQRKPNRPVIVDTNLLLDLFGGDNKYGYDTFWDYSLENNIDLYITPITITEYVNRRCRFAYSYYLETLNQRYENGENILEDLYDYKKGFQRTSDYLTIFQDSLKQVKMILECVTVLNIEQDDLMELDPIKYDLKDYNDAIYYHIAVQNNWGIVTHDRDFINSPYPLIVFTNLK